MTKREFIKRLKIARNHFASHGHWRPGGRMISAISEAGLRYEMNGCKNEKDVIGTIPWDVWDYLESGGDGLAVLDNSIAALEKK